jgi:hypothetical protein
MPKDTVKNRYFDVAVPRLNTLLLDLLKEMHMYTNIAESQLLVQFATEYAKQIRGQPTSLTAMGQLLPAMASIFSAMPHAQVPLAQTNGASHLMSPVQSQGIQSLAYNLMQHGVDERDMDAYGEPD